MALPMELTAVVTLYLGILFGIIIFAGPMRKGEKPKSLIDEQYLAGRGLGPAVLGVSVCASMFSGYTVIGIPAESFGNGFSAWRWIASCTFISIVYMCYSPRLYRLSKAKGYNSVLDVVRDRYQLAKFSPLYWTMIIAYMIPCLIYTWNQFVAFSNTVNALFGIPKVVGSFALCVMLVAYELLGGLRAVAWTDLLQGTVLATGAMCFLAILLPGQEDVSVALLETDPAHITVMDSAKQLGWGEFMLNIGFQRALFPDYPARVMAAESEKTLRTAQLILLAAPFFVQFPLVFVGLKGRVLFPDTENAKSIFSLVVMDIIESGAMGRIFGSLSLAASLAAIMSTADSCLIAVSHMLTLDVIKPLMADDDTVEKEEKDKKLLMFGRGITVLLGVACAGLAAIKEFNLSFMIGYQSVILAQCFPAIVLGLYFENLSEYSVLAGLLVGELVGVPLKTMGVQGGVLLAIFLNVVVTFGVSMVIKNEKGVPSGFGFGEKAKEIHTALTEGGELRNEPVGAVKPMVLVGCVIPWLAIPFYRTSGEEDSLIMGVPVWAVCSLVVLVLSHAFLAATLIKGWDVNEPDSTKYVKPMAGQEVGKTED